MSLPPKGKILALDLGTRRTGVAITDETQSIAFLRDEIEHTNNEELYFALQKLIAEEKVVGLLVGFPTHLSGEASEQTERVQNQIDELKNRFSLPLVQMDERLSSRQAADIQSKVVDSRAAHILLDTYLNFLRHED